MQIIACVLFFFFSFLLIASDTGKKNISSKVSSGSCYCRQADAVTSGDFFPAIILLSKSDFGNAEDKKLKLRKHERALSSLLTALSGKVSKAATYLIQQCEEKFPHAERLFSCYRDPPFAENSSHSRHGKLKYRL